MPIVTLRDRDGVLHEALDQGGTVCGGGYRPNTTGTEAVTCFACLFPTPETDCGHLGATIRNCPGAADLKDDHNQRCRCCSDCEKSCAEDV
jgi:hypothetical protein